MPAREVVVSANGVRLNGTLTMAREGARVVLFAHGSGSRRGGPRNRYVAAQLHEAGIGSLLFDLLTEEEEAVDRITAQLRFDIGLLADRLEAVTEWMVAQDSGGEGLAGPALERATASSAPSA